MRCVSLVLVVLLAAGAQAEEKLPSRDLRGYGRTSAVKDGNRITLTCADEAKARLWAARYDHVYGACRVRPGVYRLPGGGWVRLYVDGSRLDIEYSDTEPEQKGASDIQLPTIPMFLNEYDDFAFRFYYWPGQTPPREGSRPDLPWAQYDPTGEFDFAKANGEAGIILWNNPHRCDTAKGFDERREWGWAKGLSDARSLPVVLNANLGVPMWALDEAREESEEHAPGYVGSYHSIGEPFHAGEGFVSWASIRTRQRLLDDLAASVREFDTDNVVNVLEPHGELNHGPFTIFAEHGMAADESFREMLRERYGDVKTVSMRWDDPSLRSWDDVRLPAVCEFAGFGPEAIDLQGPWQMRDAGSKNSWERVLQMPGHDIGLFLPKRRREFLRQFELPAQPSERRTWLYVWDLSDAFRERVVAKLNDVRVLDEAVRHFNHHWAVAEVTDTLREGQNELLLELPNGKACYKVYLTHEEPKSYPYFGRGKNAKWADFCAWQSWCRMKSVRRGLDTLRSVEPDKTIVAMSPWAYFNDMRELAGEYGTRFHDTGSMAAYWWTGLPQLMHSKGLPFSLEPGGPAANREEFKRMTNFYLSEGVNAIHYFIHIGCVSWNPEIREEFKRRLPALKMMGRYEVPECEIAMVDDSMLHDLVGYPWGGDPAAAYPSGYNNWRFPSALGSRFDMDVVTPYDLRNFEADRYRFLLDANRTVMTPEDAQAVERYVREGGTYVAMFETGRHMPEEPDRWVLRDLAGVEVQRLSRYALRPGGDGVPQICLVGGKTKVSVAEGNGIYPTGQGRLSELAGADGVFLRPVDKDVRVIWRWEDGTAAVTVRKFGKGRFVTFGLRPDNIYQAWEHDVLGELLAALGATEKTLDAKCGRGFGRHYVTTDGLYDVWYADAGDRPGPYELRFRDGRIRELKNVLTGEPLPCSGELGPNDFVMAKSHRDADSVASWHWIKNQFGWWRGRGRKAAPSDSDVSGSGPLRHHDVVDMSSMLGGERTTADYVAEGSFAVPSDWTDGRIELWCVGLYAHTFTHGRLTVELNGTALKTEMPNGVAGLELPLAAGERFRLRLSVQGDDNPSVHGFRGPVYLFYRPNRKVLKDLAGEWERYGGYADAHPQAVALPGKVERCAMLRRVFDLEELPPERRVRLVFTGRNDGSGGVIVNGHYLRRHHHRFGNLTDIDITPWLRFRGKNEIILVHITDSSHFDIRDIRLLCGEKGDSRGGL